MSNKSEYFNIQVENTDESYQGRNSIISDRMAQNLADLRDYLNSRTRDFFMTSFGGNLTDQRMITIGGVDLAFLLNDCIKLDYKEDTGSAKFYLDFLSRPFSSGDSTKSKISLLDLVCKHQDNVNYLYNLGYITNNVNSHPRDNLNYSACVVPRRIFSNIDDDTLYIDERLMRHWIRLGHITEGIESSSFDLFSSISKILLSLANLCCYCYLEEVDDLVNPTVVTPTVDSFEHIDDEQSIRLALALCDQVINHLTLGEVNLFIPFLKNKDSKGSSYLNVSGQLIGAVTEMGFKEFLQIVIPVMRILINASPISKENEGVYVGFKDGYDPQNSTTAIPAIATPMGDPHIEIFRGKIDTNANSFMTDRPSGCYKFISADDYSKAKGHIYENNRYNCLLGSGSNTRYSDITNRDIFQINEIVYDRFYHEDYNLKLVNDLVISTFTDSEPIVTRSPNCLEFTSSDNHNTISVPIEVGNILTDDINIFNIYYSPLRCFRYNEYINILIENISDFICVKFIPRCESYHGYLDMQDEATFVEGYDGVIRKVIYHDYLQIDGASAGQSYMDAMEKSVNYESYQNYLQRLYSITIDALLNKHSLYDFLVDSVQPSNGYSPTLLSFSLECLQSKVVEKASRKLAIIDQLKLSYSSTIDDIIINDLYINYKGDSIIIYLYKNGVFTSLPKLDGQDDEFITIRIPISEKDELINILSSSISDGNFKIPYLLSESAANPINIKVQGSVIYYDLLTIDASNGKFCTRSDEWAQINANTKILVSVPPRSKVSYCFYSPAYTVNGGHVDDNEGSFYNYSNSPITIELIATSNTYIKHIIIEGIGSTLSESIYSLVCNDNNDNSDSMLDSYSNSLTSNIVEIQENIYIDQIASLVESYLSTMEQESISYSDVDSIVNSLTDNVMAGVKDTAISVPDQAVNLKNLSEKILNRCQSIKSKVKDSFFSLKASTGQFLSVAGSRVSNLTSRIGSAINGSGELFGSLFGANQVDLNPLGWSDSSNYTSTSSLALALNVSFDLPGIIKIGACVGSLINKGITWAYDKCSSFIAETINDGISYKVNHSGFECLDVPAYQKKMSLDDFANYNPFVYNHILQESQSSDKITFVTQINSVLIFYQYYENLVYVSFAPVLYDYDLLADSSDFELLDSLVKSRIRVTEEYNELITRINGLISNLSSVFRLRGELDSLPTINVPTYDSIMKFVFKGASVSYVEKVTTTVKKYSSAVAAASAVCLLIPGIRWFALATLAVSTMVSVYSDVVEKVCTTNDLSKVLAKAAEDSTYANNEIETYELFSVNAGYDSRIFDYYNKLISKLGTLGFVSCGDGELSINGNYIPLAMTVNKPSFKFHLLTDSERDKTTTMRLLIGAGFVLGATLACFKVTSKLNLKAKENKILTNLMTLDKPNSADFDDSSSYAKALNNYKKTVSKNLRRLKRVESKLGNSIGASVTSLSILLDSDTSDANTGMIQESLSGLFSEQAGSIEATSSLIKGLDDKVINNISPEIETLRVAVNTLSKDLSSLSLSLNSSDGFINSTLKNNLDTLIINAENLNETILSRLNKLDEDVDANIKDSSDTVEV